MLPFLPCSAGIEKPQSVAAAIHPVLLFFMMPLIIDLLAAHQCVARFEAHECQTKVYKNG